MSTYTDQAKSQHSHGRIPLPSSMELPFVYRSRRDIENASNWHVPPVDDYGEACERGREYAALYLQQLVSPDGGHLGDIAADIDFSDDTATKGYWVGFFSYLERMLYFAAQKTDVQSDVTRVNAFYAELNAKRESEEQTR